MSKARDIAFELWGEAEAASMTSSQVYQRLARGIVKSMVGVVARSIGDVDLVSSPEDRIYLRNISNRVTEYSDQAISSAAYALGYEAQLQDATADEAARYKMLEKLSAYYQILGSE